MVVALPGGMLANVRSSVALSLLLFASACDTSEEFESEFLANGQVQLAPTRTVTMPLPPRGFTAAAIEGFQAVQNGDKMQVQGPIMSAGTASVKITLGNSIPPDPFTGEVNRDPIAAKFVVLYNDGGEAGWQFVTPVTELTQWSRPANAPTNRVFGLFPVHEQVGKYNGVLNVAYQ